MKLLIASDIHGDLESCKMTLEAYKAEGADKLVLLGDILYHGPRNDLPPTYAPKEVIRMLNGIKSEILAVRGNCDTEVDQMVLEFPILADYAFISADGLSIFATHGHKFNLEALPPMKRGEILLHGHTHILTAEKFGDENHYLNPGSVSLPKSGNLKTYMIYENRRFTVKSFDGNIIFELDLN